MDLGVECWAWLEPGLFPGVVRIRGSCVRQLSAVLASLPTPEDSLSPSEQTLSPWNAPLSHLSPRMELH